MNELINVDITFYFEISNSEVFGGIGSTGYSKAKYGGIKDLDAAADAVESQREIQADMLGVPLEDAKLISKEKYDSETEEDGDSEDEEDW